MVTHEPSFPQVVGACIYCGRRDEKLSDEHVIRYGLGGTWILKKASCGAHRDVTAAIEGDVLHHAWGPARAVLGIRTRRKQERANGFRVKVEIRGALKSVPVSTEGHPGAIIMPVFAPPGVLPVKPKIPGTSVVRLQGAYRSKKAKALAVQHNADAIRIRYPEPITFARVLAKIGYSFAVSSDGLAACRDAPVIRAILDHGPSVFDFVGNDRSLGVHTSEVAQEVTMSADNRGRLVFIRLLGSGRDPEYVVRIDLPGTG